MKLHQRFMLRRLLSYHEGDLPDTDRTAVEQHLAGCAECRLFLHRMGRTDELVTGALPANEPLHPEAVRAGLARALTLSGALNRPFAGALFGAFGLASIAVAVCTGTLAVSHGRGKSSQMVAQEPLRPDRVWFDRGSDRLPAPAASDEHPRVVLVDGPKHVPRHRWHARRRLLIARSLRPRHRHHTAPMEVPEVPDVPSAPAALPGSVVLVAAVAQPGPTAGFYDSQTTDGIQASVRYVDTDTPGYAEAASVRSNLGIPTWTKATVSSEQPGSEVVERPLVIAGLPR